MCPESVFVILTFSTLPRTVNNQKPSLESVYLALSCELVLKISDANQPSSNNTSNSICLSFCYMKLEFS